MEPIPKRRTAGESGWSERAERLDAVLRELLDPESGRGPRLNAPSEPDSAASLFELLSAFFDDGERFDRLVRSFSRQPEPGEADLSRFD